MMSQNNDFSGKVHADGDVFAGNVFHVGGDIYFPTSGAK